MTALYGRYLHVQGIPAYVVQGQEGRVYIDPLWHRDLRHHSFLGAEITVLCPRIVVTRVAGHLEEFAEPGFTFLPLPAPCSTLRYFATGRILKAALAIWRGVGSADVVFSQVVDHPIPLGWMAMPMARLRGATSYTYLEGTPWRKSPFLRYSPKFLVRSWVTERVNRVALRCLTFAFITQPAYADLLAPGCPCLVSPASWFLLSEMSAAPVAQDDDTTLDDRTHLLFVGRLEQAKGVQMLLDALAAIDRPANSKLAFTMVGDGRMRATVEGASARLRHISLHLAEPVDYGPDYFALFSGIDALVLANLTSEQPRNVYEAWSQGVPVLASNTTGLTSIVVHDQTGLLFDVGSTAGLTAAIERLMTPDAKRRLRAMGVAGYEVAKGYDHVEMHRRRRRWLTEPAQAALSGRRRQARNAWTRPTDSTVSLLD
ncbi:MAG: glycosyltransferase family 4 protein [Ilumatobacteraceae bacterium]